MNLDTYILGARLFYWLYLLGTLLFAGAIVVYWNRERLKRKWYELRIPERLIIVGIVYPGNYVRRWARLIPDDSTFALEGGTYNYNAEAVLKHNLWYAIKDQKDLTKLIIRIPKLDNPAEFEEYFIKDNLKIKERWDRWPEIYYRYGCPWPIDFLGTDDKGLPKFNTNDLDRLKKSTLLSQLYASVEGSGLLIVVLILLVVVLIAVGVTLAKTMGWLH